MRDDGPILVPLDGSELAEGALSYASALAAAWNTKLILLTVWEGVGADMTTSFPDMAVEVESTAQGHFGDYLASCKTKVGGAAETMLRAGDASEEILKAADEVGARAITIATHGRSGISRWMAGSTATDIIHHATVPVLTVGPNALQKPPQKAEFKHVMVPLDGSALAEQALQPGAALAKATAGRLSLVRALQWAVQAYPYTLPDAYVPQIDTELEAGAKEYLRNQETKVAGVDVKAYVVRGAIPDGLMEFVDKESVDLVVMTTRGRRGLARAALGSVADRMLQAACPVLMLRGEA
jgi:nucleotide-binding universal stress UspA family protein